MAVKKWTALFLSVLLLTGCTQEPAPSSPRRTVPAGTVPGTGEGYGGTITVEVEVSADRIEAVSILSHNESRGVCEAAFEQIPAEILRQGTPYVELVAGRPSPPRG
ncbi:MAG: FMN-binding protein [Acutalibacteraceae bacterium]